MNLCTACMVLFTDEQATVAGWLEALLAAIA